MFFMLVGLGYAAARLGARRVIGLVVLILLYLVIPLAVARAYALNGLRALTDYSLLALLAFAATVPYASLAAARLCRGDPACRPAVLLTLLFPNTVFLPLSLAPLLRLDVDAIMSYALPLTLLHFTLGYRLGGVKPRLDVPLLVSASAATGLAANLLGFTRILSPLWSLAGLLGAAAGYLSIFVVGASLPEPHRLTLRDPLLAASIAWRSLASLAIHLCLAALLGVHAGLRTILVEAVMAPATMNAVIARHLGADYERVATVILLHTPIAAAEAALIALAL